METTMKELRAQADIRDAETQKLEVTNAELRRSLLLRAEQQVELAQRSERSLRELEARWVLEGLQAGRVPLTVRPQVRHQQCIRGSGPAAPPEQGITQRISPHLDQPNAWSYVYKPPMFILHPGIQPKAALEGAPCSFGAPWA